MKALFSVAFPLAFIVVSSFAQSNADTAFVLQAKSHLQKFYAKETLKQSALYNGREYVEPRRTNETHPFFETDDWAFGSVHYHGHQFDNVPLLYDVTSDKVVTEMFYNAAAIVLVPEFLTSFSMNGHEFIKIRNETVNYTLPATGFYEVLYNGPARVIVRHEKKIHERIETNQIQIDFEERAKLFIYHNGRYHSIKSKASALKVWEDQKQALKQYAAKNKLKFRKQRVSTLVRLAELYDTLNKRR